MSFGIIATVGATLGAAALTSRSQRKAADTQVQASSNANQLIRQQFLETKGQLQPFITGAAPAFQLQQAQSGALGAPAQQQAFQNFNESPGVAFMRERGLRAIDRNAAARGSLIGGNTDKARISFSQGIAQQDFGNQFNRLGSITGTGLAAAQALGGVGSQAAQGQASNVQQAGIAQAQGQLGRAKTFGSALGDLSAIFGNRGLFGEKE
jgi:hypothetical protein